MRIALPRRLVERSAWVAISIVFGRSMFLVAGLVLARLLGSQQFGILSTAQTTVTFLAFIVGYGLGQTATKVISEADESQKSAFADALSRLSTYATLVLLPIAAVVGAMAGELVLRNSTISYLVFVLLGVPLGTVALLVSQGLLAGIDDFRGLAAVAFVSGGTVLLSALLAVVVADSLRGVAIAISIGYAASALACIAVANRRLLQRTRPSELRVPVSNLLGSLSGFALPRSLYGGVPAVATWISITLLAGWLHDYSEVAVYAVADQWFLVVMVVPAALCSAAFPTLTTNWRKGQHQEVISLLRKLLVANGAVSIGVAAVFALASPILGAVYGEAFASRTITFQLSFLAAAVAATQVPGHYFLAATGKAWWSFHVACSSTALSVVAAFVLVDFGSAGVAAARIIGFVAQAAFMFGCVRAVSNSVRLAR